MESSGTRMNFRTVRKWQVFPGRNNFCCDGRIIMGASPWIFCFTCVLIIVTSGLFFAVEYVLFIVCFLFVVLARALPQSVSVYVSIYVCLTTRESPWTILFILSSLIGPVFSVRSTNVTGLQAE